VLDALQKYVLMCCQSPSGGLRDKPSKSVFRVLEIATRLRDLNGSIGRPQDYYHTCYVLSGLSIAQHYVCASVSLDVKYSIKDGFGITLGYPHVAGKKAVELVRFDDKTTA
jgi:prenyltransferase beta subunit